MPRVLWDIRKKLFKMWFWKLSRSVYGFSCERCKIPKNLKNKNNIYPPASKGNREVSNLTEIKNPHTPNMVSNNLSVCLFQILTPIILALAEQNWPKKFWGHLWKMNVLKKFYLFKKRPVGPGPRAKTATFWHKI